MATGLRGMEVVCAGCCADAGHHDSGDPGGYSATTLEDCSESSGFHPNRRSSGSKKDGLDLVFRSAIADLQYGKKRFLRNIDAAHTFHPPLTFLLLFEELAFAADITAIALSQNILTHGGDGFACDNLGPDRGLKCNFEHLARNELAHALDERLTPLVRKIPMDDHRQRVDRFARNQHIQPNHR